MGPRDTALAPSPAGDSAGAMGLPDVAEDGSTIPTFTTWKATGTGWQRPSVLGLQAPRQELLGKGESQPLLSVGRANPGRPLPGGLCDTGAARNPLTRVCLEGSVTGRKLHGSPALLGSAAAGGPWAGRRLCPVLRTREASLVGRLPTPTAGPLQPRTPASPRPTGDLVCEAGPAPGRGGGPAPGAATPVRTRQGHVRSKRITVTS